MKIGIIGCGRVGTSFGTLLKEKYDVVFYSEPYSDALCAANQDYSLVCDSPLKLVECSDVIFITVPDTNINTVWEKVKYYAEGKLVCHMSGAMETLSAFPDCEKFNVKVASLHPVMAVSSKDDSQKLKDAVYTVEGTGADDIIKTFDFLKIHKIDSEKKALYHAACVFASNLIHSCVRMSVEELEKCGFSPEDGLKLIENLTTENTANIFKKGFKESLTGPVDRNDISTIKKHLSVLEGENKEAYVLLTKKLVSVAKEKNQWDYNELLTALERSSL